MHIYICTHTHKHISIHIYISECRQFVVQTYWKEIGFHLSEMDLISSLFLEYIFIYLKMDFISSLFLEYIFPEYRIWG